MLTGVFLIDFHLLMWGLLKIHKAKGIKFNGGSMNGWF